MKVTVVVGKLTNFSGFKFFATNSKSISNCHYNSYLVHQMHSPFLE